MMYFNGILNYRKNKDGDLLEGTIPYNNRLSVGNEYLRVDFKGQLIEAGKKEEQKKSIVELFNHFIFVNCWRIDKKENMKMWEGYTKNKPDGILIKSTVGGLKRAFACCKYDLYIGKVKYITHAEYKHNVPNPYSYAFLKDKIKFEYEKELRLMINYADENTKLMQEIYSMEEAYDIFNIDEIYNNKMGYIYACCNLDKLIDAIILSPYANRTMKEKISAKLKYYGIDKPICDSFFR